MIWSGLVLAAAALDAVVTAVPDVFQLKHSWSQVPTGWQLEGAAPPNQTLNFVIGLKEGNIQGLIDQLYAVSDPKSPKYGQHLSKAEVDQLVAPAPESVKAVDAWLTSAGIDPASVQRSTAGDWIKVPISVAHAGKMLNANYSIFHNAQTGVRNVRTLAWSLPASIHPHIDILEPTTMFSKPLSPRVIQKKPSTNPNAVPPRSCINSVTPSCLRTLYNTAGYVPAATSQNSLGVAGYLGEFANRADLQTFFQRFRTDAVGSSYTTVLVNGGGDDQTNPGVEANLDIQYATGISFPTPNTYYSTGGDPPFNPDQSTPTNTNEPYIDWLTFILNQTSVPQTFTTSYGDDEQTVPNDYAVRACNSFAQLGARGSSIMFSSGDSGVGPGSCLSNDGTNTVKFLPAFPASCPFVTTVGGTININPERAVSFSGGGFSNYFGRPTYQDAAVQGFLTHLGSTNAGLFNASGRAYPDVAAQAENFQVVVGGSVTPVAGTSCSSPTFAAVISLLNDARLAANKTSLGFLNPLLYANNGSGLTDITSGSNPGCGTNGFTAVAGWDPVTGWGTPDFTKLRTLFG